jgi:hypothetical protein
MSEPCPRCGGTGEIPSPGWFVVQLYEGDKWNDWLEFPTREEAIAKAEGTGWGEKARIRRGPRVVWRGSPDARHGWTREA